ncbi:ABC transporter permease subunit [Paracoccus onubensis]|uniref:ABC transporter permease subunit n=1 Tax=Paracoccus onubensis TaxID=1675788 RepID=UPI002730987B|nr:ABC transporter permease subunit [Paracoccus onubensis]MDP0927587.1 ABC transporter permease subunit [Paracoccus onubensis]
MSNPNHGPDAYLREEMLPEMPPPPRETGMVKWLHENLFSGPVNAGLTVLGLLIVWFLFDHFYPWFAHSVWNASSLPECRKIIAETWGEGAGGACFAVIRERWNQYIYGFYPPGLYWRPTLVFGLLFVALAPILFSISRNIRRIVLLTAAIVTVLSLVALNTPPIWLGVAVAIFAVALLVAERRQMWLLGFSAFYPLLGVWLIWGGSFWWIIMILAGMGFGSLAFIIAGRLSPLLAGSSAIVVTLLVWVFLSGDAAKDAENLYSLAIARVDSEAIGGFLLAITIGVAGITMSLPLGIVLALARRSDMFLVSSLAVIFIEFIRGVPLITLLFVAQLLLNYFLPPGTSFDIVLRVIIMVTLFAAAYMAEVIRGGLAALPTGQYEAADALGLDYWKAQRLIVLPQALKISIPGIVSTFIGMFKDTTLVAFVGLYEPLKNISDAVRANIEWKGIYWEPFIFVGAIFFIICFSMSRYSMYLERRLQRDNR